MPEASYFLDDSVVAVRGPEVPDASFANGMNAGGSCAPGIGLLINGAITGDPAQFTLLDQDGDARTPQVSQGIGGEGLGAGVEGKGTDALRFGNPSATGDGVVTGTGNSTLVSLAAGWTSVP